jgi:hypothetical protein
LGAARAAQANNVGITSMSSTVSAARRPAGTPPGHQKNSGNVGQLAVDALVVEGAAVLEELFTVIGEEDDQRAPVEAISPSRSRRRPSSVSMARMEPS